MESVSKYAVSSYTPTLSALISARSKISQVSRIQVSDLRSLVLCQPTTNGYANLPNTAKELALVESLTPTSQLLRIGSGPLISSNANKTVDEAVAYLKQASILHLACHGHQDRTDPLNSGFELEDGRLTVANLISCRPPKAFLAILSACESAANDHEVPDESLNLSAAMLYAGALEIHAFCSMILIYIELRVLERYWNSLVRAFESLKLLFIHFSS
jgi:CHAT domain-containing protein